MGKVESRHPAGEGLEEWVAALDALRDPVFLHDGQMRVLRANRAYADHAGLPLERILGRPYWQMFPKLDGPMAGCLPGRRESHGEEELATPEGRVFVCRHFPIRGGGGEPLYFLHVMQDVTERRQAEETLRRNAALLERVFSSVHLLIAYMDTDFTFLRVNEAYAAADGRTPEFFVGKNHFELYPDAENQALFRRVVETGKPHIEIAKAFRYPGHPERGASYWDWSVQPVLDAKGAVEGLVFSLLDVTERVRVTERLDDLSIQMAAIVESSHDAIIGKTPDGLVTSWNRGAERIYGYSANEMIGRPVTVLALAGQKAEMVEFQRRAAEGEVQHYDSRRLCKDGRVIDVSLTLSPIRDGAGRLVGVSTISRDVTEERKAYAALRKVNRAMRALSRCNEVLVHADEEQALLADMCRVIVEVAGYRMAWVGFADPPPGRAVRPVAQAGCEAGYFESFAITWGEGDHGMGPIASAIRTGVRRLVADVRQEPEGAPWRIEGENRGYRSMLALPLSDGGAGRLGALAIYAAEANAFDDEEIGLLAELAGDLSFGIATLRTRADRRRSIERLERGLEGTIRAIAATLEIRDPYTAGHQRRVADLAVAIARAMGVPDDEVKGIEMAGVIHDIGKVYVPAEILSRPGRLSDIEFDLIKAHAQIGHDILSGVDFPWPVAQMILQHHERMDGTGYPGGLKGDQILPGARILCVADVVEAMASHRPYRAGLGIEAALAEIAEYRGKRYDPGVVDACLALFRDGGYKLGE